MSLNPNFMQYCLNIIKNKDIKKYNQVLIDLKLSQIIPNSKKNKKKRTPVPNDKKDEKYWKRRKANTESVRKSRLKKIKKKI